ncbi:hypothetical protein FKM82_016048 [Ascaphus truei]
MAEEIFSNKEVSAAYQRGFFPTSKEVLDLILSYLMEKKGKPFELAVDVGCGTGRYTRPLAPHFHKVIGTDMFESQINEALASTSEDNISYHVCPAEELLMDDATVDVVTVAFAAHYFNLEKFMQETARILKPRGCLAMHCLVIPFKIHYRDCSDGLSAIISEAFVFLHKYVDKKIPHDIETQYLDIYKAVPFADKERVTDIMVTFTMSLMEVMGLFESICCYQICKEKNPALAMEFMQNTEQRLRDTLGESSDQAIMEIHTTHYCVLACKS